MTTVQAQEASASSVQGSKAEAGRQHELTTEQIEQFQRDGYLVVRKRYDAEQMRLADRWTDEIVGLPEVPGRHMVYYEDSLKEAGRRVLSRIENFCPYHAGFDQLLNGPELLALIAQLFGEPAVLFKDKINFKLPGSAGFKAHQDTQAGWDDYAPLHISMLMSIDRATTENGCLQLAAGLHKNGLIGEKWTPMPDDGSDGIEYIACPTEPGDVVFFDSYAPHRSDANMTDQTRRILYVTWNKSSEGDHRAQYYADKRLSYPPDVEREPGKDYSFRV